MENTYSYPITYTNTSMPLNSAQYNMQYPSNYASGSRYNNFNQQNNSYLNFQQVCYNSANFSLISNTNSTNQNEQQVASFSTAIQPQYDNNKSEKDENKENETISSNQHQSLAINYPLYFTTQKINANMVKLSYTMFQKNLLESVYLTMRYPNSDQKTLLSQRLGITRDQLKIWFQNRRRKDVLVPYKASKRKASDDFGEDNNFDSEVVAVSSPDQNGCKKPLSEDQIKEKISIENVLNELKTIANGPSRLVKKSTASKKSKNNSLDEKSFSNNSNEIIDSKRFKSETDNDNEQAIEQCSHLNTSSATSLTTTRTVSSYGSSSASSFSSCSSSEEEKRPNYEYPIKEISENANINFNVIRQTYSMQDYADSKRAHGAPSFRYPKMNSSLKNVGNEVQAAYYYQPSAQGEESDEWPVASIHPAYAPQILNTIETNTSFNYQPNFHSKLYAINQQATNNFALCDFKAYNC